MRALPIVHVTNRRYAGRLFFSIAALGWTLTFASSCAFSVPGRSARVVRRFPAHEATQAVAVDAQFFYAIDDAAIGKYQKDTGQGASKWEETPGGPVTHLNSGIVQDGLLYCAHSNYPGIPMVSSVEVFETAAMTHVRSIPLPPGFGSATWVDRADGQWWVTFAQYAGKGGEAGKGPKDTVVVKFDDRWQKQASWTFPERVIVKWGTMSSSGGTWAGRLLYTTGHDAPELYVLAVPASGSTLQLREVVRMESHGQGIAIDRATGLLYSIQRRSREVLVSELPAIQ